MNNLLYQKLLSNILSPLHLLKSHVTPLICTTFVPVRYRRRTSKPANWFVIKKAKTHIDCAPLSSENVNYLRERENEIVNNLRSRKIEGEVFDEQMKWKVGTSRVGVIAVKIGVMSQWTNEGKHFYTTLLQLFDNQVIRYTDPETFRESVGFKKKKWVAMKHKACCVVGALDMPFSSYTKSYNNLFSEAQAPPKRKLTRFLITPDAFLEPGTKLDVSHFKVGQYVDVQAKTIGHGFQGVVKRWQMAGGPATHGSTKWHRRIGSISEGRSKGISKGRRFPGHMGMDYVISKALKIWRINKKHNILYIHGQAIPGPTNSYCRVYDTTLTKKRNEMLRNPPPMPTCQEQTDVSYQEIFCDKLHQLDSGSITFSEE